MDVNPTFEDAMFIVMPPDILKKIALKQAISRIVDCDERNRMSELREIEHMAVTIDLCM